MSRLVDNAPLPLMDGTNIIEENLKEAKVTYADLRAKLRQANVPQIGQVKAVVMESTDHVCVLHHSGSDHELDSILLEGVNGYDRDGVEI